MAAMIKGILLDIDGTLVLSNEAHAHSWVDAFAKYGYTVAFDKALLLIGMGGDKLISTLQPELNDQNGDGKKIKQARSEIFLNEYAPKLKAAHGSRDLVQALKDRGLKVIAASSSSKKELGTLLKAAGVKDLLTEATSSDDAENSKPSPDILQVALKKISLSPNEVFMIGDTPYDVKAATRASIRCITVRCGGWSDEELAGSADTYDDPMDILHNIGKILV